MKHIGRILLHLALSLIVIAVIALGAVSASIGFGVNRACKDAQKSYSGDCVDALTGQLTDEKSTFRTRNTAIWALGQLGDSRALPALRRYYTGKIPPREPIDAGISQYELKKAIHLLEGGINITAVFWRYGMTK